MSYYYLKRNEKNIFEGAILTIVLFLIALCYYGYMSFDTLFVFYMPFVIISITCPQIQKGLRFLVFDFPFIFLFIAPLFFWIFNIEVPYLNIVISDNKMVVFSSILYAYLTFKNIQYSSRIFKYQRMPNITISAFKESESELVRYQIKNESNYPAKDVKIYFEFLYPIPEKTLIRSFSYFIKRSSNYLFYILNPLAKRPDYISLVSERWIEPNSIKKVSVRNETIKLIDVSKNELCIDCENRKNYFEVIVSWDFVSVDNFFVANRIYKNFRYELSTHGLKFDSDSDEPIQIY